MARSGPLGQAEQEVCLKGFRRRLMDAMKEEHYDANTLAEAMDMTRPAVTQYLNGVRLPNMVALVRVARNLNRSADWLIGLSDTPTPPQQIEAENAELRQLLAELFDEASRCGRADRYVERVRRLRIGRDGRA